MLRCDEGDFLRRGAALFTALVDAYNARTQTNGIVKGIRSGKPQLMLYLHSTDLNMSSVRL